MASNESQIVSLTLFGQKLEKAMTANFFAIAVMCRIIALNSGDESNIEVVAPRPTVRRILAWSKPGRSRSLSFTPSSP